ncbi:MAG: hypothetical protein WBA44_07295 [Mesorhizobium sp.]
MILLPRLTVAFAVAAVMSATIAYADEPVELITVAEAQLPPATSDGIDRNITRGPGIDAVAPSPIGVEGTFRFAVKFKPRNGVAIDPAQVRVTYMREPNIDLTARLKDFISADGIEAPNVLAPAGEHLILIEAVDLEGRTGRGEMTVTVTGQ